MLSANTWKIASGVKAEDLGSYVRSIKVKHHKDLVQSMEIQLLDTEMRKRQKDITLHQLNFLNPNVSIKNRMDVSKHKNRIIITGPGFTGRVLDFSRYGFALQLDKYFGLGVTQDVKLSSDDPKLNQMLSNLHLSNIGIEMKWGTPKQDGTYLHGCEWVTVSQSRKEELFDVLMNSYQESQKSA